MTGIELTMKSLITSIFTIWLSTALTTAFAATAEEIQLETEALNKLYTDTCGVDCTWNYNILQAPCGQEDIQCTDGNVDDLFLDNKGLTGSIPTELSTLTHLVNLYLHTNNLSGSIPAELGNLTHLEMLDLSYNQLGGSIPAELGNLTKLKRLRLHDNQLNGSIPVELGNLTNLSDLILNDNQLSGSIPAELANASLN